MGMGRSCPLVLGFGDGAELTAGVGIFGGGAYKPDGSPYVVAAGFLMILGRGCIGVSPRERQPGELLSQGWVGNIPSLGLQPSELRPRKGEETCMFSQWGCSPVSCGRRRELETPPAVFRFRLQPSELQLREVVRKHRRSPAHLGARSAPVPGRGAPKAAASQSHWAPAQRAVATETGRGGGEWVFPQCFPTTGDAAQ